MNITAANIVNEIDHLNKSVFYNYINRKNRGVIKIVRVERPEGPIFIKRGNFLAGKNEKDAKEVSISANMIWRVANAIQEDIPINIDRIVAASYNTRSVLESLLAYTPAFYITYPGRIENNISSSKIKPGHKHLIWRPNDIHEEGKLKEFETSKVISEIPSQLAIYEALTITPQSADKGNRVYNIETERRHTQIQIALYLIGKQLGFRTWIAQNDKSIVYNNQKLGEMDGVIVSLKDEQLLMSYQEAVKAALLIDCIWFKNGKFMPAIMEVEHTTGITSGLSRMKNFKDKFPPFPTRYVIVAPDEDRKKVLQECNKEQFRDLNPLFFPYSSVEELYSLCQRRKLKGVTEDFLDCFMEKTAYLQQVV
jgi:type II restriction enzyme